MYYQPSALFPVFVSLQATEVDTEGRELADGQQLEFPPPGE